MFENECKTPPAVDPRNKAGRAPPGRPRGTSRKHWAVWQPGEASRTVPMPQVLRRAMLHAPETSRTSALLRAGQGSIAFGGLKSCFLEEAASKPSGKDAAQLAGLRAEGEAWGWRDSTGQGEGRRERGAARLHAASQDNLARISLNC